MQDVDLDLTTMVDLNQEVRNVLPALVKSLQEEKDKATLSISISFQRVKDTDTMLQVTHSVKPGFPKRARAILARQDLLGNLTTEVTPTQKNLFPQEVKTDVGAN